MKDLFAGLAAAMAGFATLAALFVSTDVTNHQNKLVTERHISIDHAFAKAQHPVTVQRYALLALPSFLAFAFSLAILFM